MFATAIYAWRARVDGDLSFAKGDRIEILEREEMRWKGRLGNGQSGWFPKSYVKVEEIAGGVSQATAQVPSTTANGVSSDYGTRLFN